MTEARENDWIQRWSAGHWLATAGTMALLAALTLLAALVHSAPAIRLALVAVIAAAFLSAGFRLEQAASAQSYARILMSGLLAAVFYLAFAAAHVDWLRIIGSPVLGGVILLVAGVWIARQADRRRSEPMALLTLGLAWCATSFQPQPRFSMSVNLVLAAAAAFVLVRHGWAGPAFFLLPAAYAAFGAERYWSSQPDPLTHYLTSNGQFWKINFFFTAHWLLFTLAALWSGERRFTEHKRAALTTLNNALFIGLVASTVQTMEPGWVWRCVTGFGLTLLLMLAPLATRLQPRLPFFSRAFVAQGVVLIAAGLAVRFTGEQLSLLLGIVSVLCLLACRYLNYVALRLASLLLAVGAAMAAWPVARRPGLDELSIAIGTSALLFFNAWWAHRKRPDAARLDWVAFAYAVCGLSVWLVIAFRRAG